MILNGFSYIRHVLQEMAITKVQELKGRLQFNCVSTRCGLVTLHDIIDPVGIGSGNDLVPDGNGSSAEKKWFIASWTA